MDEMDLMDLMDEMDAAHRIKLRKMNRWPHCRRWVEC